MSTTARLYGQGFVKVQIQLNVLSVGWAISTLRQKAMGKMSKVNCKDCQFYHNGRCEELGEYTTPGECECSWFALKAVKTVVLQDNGWRIIEEKKPTLFERISASPEVLAPYCISTKPSINGDTLYYYSTVTSCIYLTEPEAISATVAKLKEVCNGNQ